MQSARGKAIIGSDSRDMMVVVVGRELGNSFAIGRVRLSLYSRFYCFITPMAWIYKDLEKMCVLVCCVLV